jgi:molybdopterin synthase sulfur carrier subunit
MAQEVEMNITLRFFAGVREALGTSQEELTLPDHVKTVGQVRRHLHERGGAWAEALAEGRAVRMAFNHQMTGPDTAIEEGCEVAFFPPVTGG